MRMQVYLVCVLLTWLGGVAGCDDERNTSTASGTQNSAAAELRAKASRARSSGNVAAADRFADLAAEIETNGVQVLNERLVIVSSVATRDAENRPRWIMTATVSTNLEPSVLVFSEGATTLLELPVTAQRAATDRFGGVMLTVVRLGLIDDKQAGDAAFDFSVSAVNAALQRGELTVRARGSQSATVSDPITVETSSPKPDVDSGG